MALFVDRGDATTGRHRSPWRRSGRILPIRWVRVVALAAAALLLGASAGYLRLRSGGWGVPPGRHPVTAVTPMSVSASGNESGDGGRTSAAASSAPGTGIHAAGAPAAGGVDGSSGQPGKTQPGALPVGAARASASIVGANVSVVLSQSTLDLGSVNSSATVDLHNTGTAPADFQFGATATWLTVTPAAGTIAGGAHRAVTFSLDRTAAPAGVVDVSVAVAAHGGAQQAGAVGAVRVIAQVSGPPVIDSVATAPTVLYTLGCPPTSRPTLSVVSVRTTDSTGVFGVELIAKLPDGRTTTTGLNLDDATGQQSVWSGPVGSSGAAGLLSFTVTVTDINGLRAQSTGSLEVRTCPAPTSSASPTP